MTAISPKAYLLSIAVIFLVGAQALPAQNQSTLQSLCNLPPCNLPTAIEGTQSPENNHGGRGEHEGHSLPLIAETESEPDSDELFTSFSVGQNQSSTSITTAMVWIDHSTSIFGFLSRAPPEL